MLKNLLLINFSYQLKSNFSTNTKKYADDGDRPVWLGSAWKKAEGALREQKIKKGVEIDNEKEDCEKKWFEAEKDLKALIQDRDILNKMLSYKDEDLSLDEYKEFNDFLLHYKEFSDYESQSSSLKESLETIDSELSKEILSNANEKYKISKRMEELNIEYLEAEPSPIPRRKFLKVDIPSSEETLQELNAIKITLKREEEKTIDPQSLTINPNSSKDEMSTDQIGYQSWLKEARENLTDSLPSSLDKHEIYEASYYKKPSNKLEEFWRNSRESWAKENMEPSSPDYSSNELSDDNMDSNEPPRKKVRWWDEVQDVNKGKDKADVISSPKGKDKADETSSPILDAASKLPSWFGKSSFNLDQPGPSSRTPTNDFIEDLPFDFNPFDDNLD